ncbi:hypothetical protein DXG01_010365 [Tephrocybe rancida]|nr:hypothetical protein DXG01_010365 [Tephrocybe rancida]
MDAGYDKDKATVCELFDRVFEEGTLERWKDGLPGGEEKLLDMSNKIVTPAAEAHDQEHVPFDPSSDPVGVMDTLMKKGFIRMEENVVQYLEGKLGLEGKRRYEKMGPQSFRVGDIVSAQLSFKAIVLKEGKMKKSRMVVVLRSLSLLARSYNFKKEELIRTPYEVVQPNTQKAPVTLKRKLRALEDEEVYEVGKRMNDMAMDARHFG